MLPKENFSMFQPLRLFLVASEHLNGEKPVSNIYPLVPSILSQMLQGCGMCLLLDIAQNFSFFGGVKKEQTCRFGHFHHSNFLLVHVLCVWMVAILKGGSQLPLPAPPPPPPPPNETLVIIAMKFNANPCTGILTTGV